MLGVLVALYTACSVGQVMLVALLLWCVHALNLLGSTPCMLIAASS